MSRLTRDGTAEPVSRDQILRHVRGQGNITFPVQLTTSRIGNLTRLIHTLLYVMTIHTYIHTCVCVIIKLHITAQSGPCVCVCCLSIHSGRQACGRTSWSHTGARSYRDSNSCPNVRERVSRLPTEPPGRPTLSFLYCFVMFFVFVFLLSLELCTVDVPLIFFCPADHVPDWQPRILLGTVEARSVNVKKNDTFPP